MSDTVGSPEATGRKEVLFEANPWYESGARTCPSGRGEPSACRDNGDAWSYFHEDHAGSRAYRWNKDGMAGLSDIRHELCFRARVVEQGSTPSLEERAVFGLTGAQDNSLARMSRSTGAVSNGF